MSTDKTTYWIHLPTIRVMEQRPDKMSRELGTAQWTPQGSLHTYPTPDEAMRGTIRELMESLLNKNATLDHIAKSAREGVTL
jgi:hypothetical protein